MFGQPTHFLHPLPGLFKTARKLEVFSTEEQLDRAGPKTGPLEDLYDQAQRRLEEFMDES